MSLDGPSPERILQSVLGDFARCVVLLHVAAEIMEDTNEVAIKIGGHELAQLPRFVLGLVHDLRVRGLPRREECVYLSFAGEVEPEKELGLCCRRTL